MNARRTVTVCDACGSKACWDGVLMCDKARTAGTIDVPAEIQRLCVRHTYLSGGQPALIVGGEDCDVCGHGSH